MEKNENQLLLNVKNLTKTFTSGLLFTKEVTALDNVSFHVQKGEILSIVGESGSGKSTTANVILRLIKPTSGSVLLDNKDISKYKKKKYYKRVQVIFQDPFGSYNLFHKVDRMLHIGFKLLDNSPSREVRNKKIREVFDIIGLRSSELLGRYPHQ